MLATTPGAELTERDGSIRYEQAVRVAALVGRVPAIAADTAKTTLMNGPAPDELRVRLRNLREVARALAERLGAVGGADRVAALRLAARWGNAPEPNPAAEDPVADQISRAQAQLLERIAAAPDEATAEGLDHAGLVAAIAALASPTGQIAICGRLRRDALPVLQESADLDTAWLTMVAPVRPPLARLEAFQLAAGTPTGVGNRLTAWTNRPADPWQTDEADTRRLISAYAPRELNLAGLPPGRMLAVGLLDRFTGTIPSAEQTTTGAFGFNAPGARAPQAILLAVPPDPARELDGAALAAIVAETRELARARMATVADLDEFTGLVPLPLLPQHGDVATRLEG